ncbi:MAG: hypothetical protein ABIH28_02760 [archaeon]
MRFETKKLLQLSIVGLILLQIGSILVAKIIDVNVIRLGWALLLLMLASALSLLVSTSFKVEHLRKEDFLYFFVLVGAYVLIYIYLPQIAPELFSIFKQGIFSTISP